MRSLLKFYFPFIFAILLSFPLPSFGGSLSVTIGGSGTVHSSPFQDINCSSGTCTQSYGDNVQVTLDASPAEGYQFDGWYSPETGYAECGDTGPCTLWLNSARTIQAAFSRKPVVTTPAPGSGTYRDTQSVTLTCSDSTATGCQSTWYCLGDGCTTMTRYTAPVSIASSSVLRFYSVGSGGEIEQTRSYRYSIDQSLGYRFDTAWPERKAQQFRGTEGVAIDGQGNVYLTNSKFSVIQKLDMYGNLVTQWGTQGSGPGQFVSPRGIAVDSLGNVYVVESNRVQQFTADGRFVTQWGSSGIGNGEFLDAKGVAVDGAGNVYVADTGNRRIQKFTPTGAYVTQWTVTETPFTPNWLAADGSGNIFVTQDSSNRIWKFDGTGKPLAQWNPPNDPSYFNTTGVAIDAGGNALVLMSYSGNGRILKYSNGGMLQTQWNSSSGRLAVAGNSLHIANSDGSLMQNFDADGTFRSHWYSRSEGNGNGEFGWLEVMAIDPAGFIYVADSNNRLIQKFDTGGEFVIQWGPYGAVDWTYRPIGLTVDPERNVYVLDSLNRIQKFDSTGLFLKEWGSTGIGPGQFHGAHGIATDAIGNVFVTDGNIRVQKFTKEGVFVTAWGSEGDGPGQFHVPYLVAVDEAGTVYVADRSTGRVQKFTGSGVYVGEWGTPGVASSAESFLVDSGGFIHILDRDDRRMKKYDSRGTLLTSWGPSGIGTGEFASLAAAAVDASGNLYLADNGLKRVQKFAPAALVPGAPTGVSATAGPGMATVSFSPPSITGGSTLSYIVTSDPGEITATGSTSPIVVRGLTGDVSYTFTVTAYNAAGSGPPSAPSNSVTPTEGYPIGVTVVGSGTVHSSPAPDMNCISGTCIQSYNKGTVVTLTATPAPGQVFAGWSGFCSGTAPCAMYIDNVPKDSIATFSEPLSLNVTISGNGAVYSSPAPDISCTSASCSQAYPSGTTVTLYPMPASGYSFAGWSGACSGTEICSLTMTSSKTAVANFVPGNPLSVTVAGSGTVHSSPAPDLNCAYGTCTQIYDTPTIVTLTASPAPGYVFSGWLGGCVGTDACTVYVDRNLGVWALFTPPPQATQPLTVNVTGSGTVHTSLSPDINCSSTGCTQPYPEGSTVILSPSPASGATFTGWSGACSGTGLCTVTMSESRTVSASFSWAGNSTLTLNVSGSGTVHSSPGTDIACTSATCSQSYANGTVVTLTPSPIAGSVFFGWSGACTGTGSCIITMGQAQTAYAVFGASTSSPLTVNVAGGGTVHSSPGVDIACSSGTCIQTFGSVGNVMLTPSPADGFTFSHWSGACSGGGPCYVTTDQARTVTATFIRRYTLTINMHGSSGVVHSLPAPDINCSTGTCTYDYGSARTLTIYPTPNDGYYFVGWAGGTCTGTTPCTVKVDAPQMVGAIFAPSIDYVLSVSVNGSGTVVSKPAGITCSGTSCSSPYTGGTVVVLTAQPAPGFKFVGWSGACSGTGPCTVTMNYSQRVGASFITGTGYKLYVNVGTAPNAPLPGTVHTYPGPDISCTSVTCVQEYAPGTVVTLTAEATPFTYLGYLFGACSGTGTCSITMNQDWTVSAGFNSCLAMVSNNCYQLIPTALSEAADGGIVRAIAFPTSVPYELNTGRSITLLGGYDGGYTTQTDFTSFSSLTVTNGSLTVGGVVIR